MAELSPASPTRGISLADIEDQATRRVLQTIVRAIDNLHLEAARITNKNFAVTWTSENDGAGSGLDADLLDGLNSTAFEPRWVVGSRIFFTNPTAPTGWTRVTGIDNGALRVVDNDTTGGTVTGTAGFTAAFANRTTTTSAPGTNAVSPGSTDGTTLTIAQIPSHTHTVVQPSGAGAAVGAGDTAMPAGITGATGGGQAHSHTHGTTHSHTVNAHSHTLDMSVKYIDVILAQRD